MIKSPLAARINGYIGGYGDEVKKIICVCFFLKKLLYIIYLQTSFESERTLLNLDDDIYDYVLEEIRSKAK